MLFSPTYIIPRYLADMDTLHQNLLNTQLGALITAAFYVLARYDVAPVASLSWLGALGAMLCGVIGFGTSLLFIYANQHDLASRVAALEFTLVVFATFLDWTVFGTAPSFSQYVICGIIGLVGAYLFQQTPVSPNPDHQNNLLPLDHSESFPTAKNKSEAFSVTINLPTLRPRDKHAPDATNP